MIFPSKMEKSAMTLEEFKKISKDEIKDLSEKEIDLLFRMSNLFANFAYKKWVESKLQNKQEKC